MLTIANPGGMNSYVPFSAVGSGLELMCRFSTARCMPSLLAALSSFISAGVATSGAPRTAAATHRAAAGCRRCLRAHKGLGR